MAGTDRKEIAIKCIIFDMDGVLVDTEALHYRVWRQVFSEQGINVEYEVYKGCIGSTAEFLYGLVDQAYGTSFRGHKELKERFKTIKREILEKEGIQAIDGVKEILSLLQKDGYSMAVASSSPQDMIDWVAELAGLSGYFELMYSAERVERPKPAPDVFLKAAEEMQMRPEECLVIEDSANGVRAAKAAGMTCFGFANPGSGNQDLSAADGVFYPFIEMEELWKRVL